MKLLSDIFRKPTPLQLAKAELEEAQRKYLDAQTALDYANAMLRYEGDRVRRLETFVGKQESAA